MKKATIWTSLLLTGLWISPIISLAADRPEYTCYRIAKAPVIDGNLSDWPELPVLFLGLPSQVSGSDWLGAKDCSGEIRLAWDDRNLYLAIKVTDDKIDMTLGDEAAGLIWQQDSIQWALDISGTGTNNYDGDDYEYGFGKTTSGPCVYRWQVSSSALVPGRTRQVPLAIVTDPAKHTIIYEAAVPFKELLPLVPRPGKRSGFTILIQDRDGERKKTLEWTSGVTMGKAPGHFGFLVFSDAAVTNSSNVFISGQSAIGYKVDPYRVIAKGCPDKVKAGWTLAHGDNRIAAQGQILLENGVGEWTLDPKAIPPGRYTLSVRIPSSKSGQFMTASMDVERLNVQTIDGQMTSLKKQMNDLADILAQVKKQGETRVETAYAAGALETARIFQPFLADDIQHERYSLVLHNLKSLSNALSTQIDSLKRQRDGRFLPGVPKHDHATAKITNGEFFIGDRPVLFVGPCSFLWQAHADRERFGRLGFNTLRADIEPLQIYDDKGEPQKDIPYWAAADVIKAGRADGMAMCSSPLPYQVAQVAQRRRPRTPDDYKREYQAYLDRHNAQIPLSRYFYHTIGVEDQRPNMFFDPVRQIGVYRDFLKREYKTIDAYNRYNNTRFTDFSQIPYPPADTADFVKKYDVTTFMQWHTGETFKWCAGEIKKRVPGALVGGYPTFLRWDDESDFFNNGAMDPEQDLAAHDLADADTAGEFFSTKYVMDTVHWLAMVRDMVGGLAPGKPQWDGEFHIVNERLIYPNGWVPAIYFQTYVHGLSGSNLWLWDRSDAIDSSVLLDAQVLLDISKTALDLRRLASEVVAFHQAPAHVAILHSQSSMPYSSLPGGKPGELAHWQQTRAIYEGLFFSGLKVGFISQRRAARGDFSSGIAKDKVKVLIVPAASHVPDECVEAIGQFARNGGKVILVGRCFEYDARGMKRERTISGANIRQLPTLQQPMAARKALLPIIAESDVMPPVRVACDSPDSTIEWRYAKDGNNELLYLLNVGHKSSVVNLVRSGKPIRGTDLISGSPIGPTQTMQSLDIILVKLEKNKF